jgi:DeoR/GlpR family transcriptional regulator of sugar metabolism
MANKSIMIDLNDSRSGKVAEVISNKTCKQVIDLLADRELSVSEISNELGIPVNTALYNIEKLADSGLIEKASWMWSIKGKKVEKYKLSNKRIIISPRKLIRGVIPALVVGGFGAYLVSMITRNQFISNDIQIVNDVVTTESVKLMASGVATGATSGASVGEIANGVISASAQGFASSAVSGIASVPVWAWFALGALTTVLVYFIYDLIYERRQR